MNAAASDTRRGAELTLRMSENDKPGTEFVNLPTPERQNADALRGATSQDNPGAVDGQPSNAGDGKPSARGEGASEPSISPSEPGLDADDDPNEKKKMLEMEKKMMELENQLLRMSQSSKSEQYDYNEVAHDPLFHKFSSNVGRRRRKIHTILPLNLGSLFGHASGGTPEGMTPWAPPPETE